MLECTDVIQKYHGMEKELLECKDIIRKHQHVSCEENKNANKENHIINVQVHFDRNSLNQNADTVVNEKLQADIENLQKQLSQLRCDGNREQESKHQSPVPVARKSAVDEISENEVSKSGEEIISCGVNGEASQGLSDRNRVEDSVLNVEEMKRCKLELESKNKELQMKISQLEVDGRKLEENINNLHQTIKEMETSTAGKEN